MSQGTLYGSTFSRGFLSQGLIQHFKLDITSATEADAAYKNAFPLAKYPAFIGPKGFKLSESLAIDLYRKWITLSCIDVLFDLWSNFIFEVCNDETYYQL